MSFSIEKNNIFVVSSQYNTIDNLIKTLKTKNIIFVYLKNEMQIINFIQEECFVCGLDQRVNAEINNKIIDRLSREFDYILLHTSCIRTVGGII